MFKFKTGDLVICIHSEEILQPMTVVGLNPWFDSSKIKVYHVKGKHRKNGNEVTVSLSESVLQKYESVV